jgi:tRNA(Arg) A34 adenosine deaminase TadA
VDEPWRTCLALAWDSYRDGTIPVGAVVTDANGAIVARGRNRIFEPDGSALAGTRLAHAEVEALAALPSSTRYQDHTLYSALEPCLLCVGAALMSTIGRVEYAAVDPYGGACRAELGLPKQPFTVEGPVGGAPGRIAAMLSAAYWLRRQSELAPTIVAAFGPGPTADAERLFALEPLPSGHFDEALPALLEAIDY